MRPADDADETGRGYSGRADDLHDLAAAYALDALDEFERARFERALEGSPDLRAEVDAFRGVAAELGDTTPPVSPPSGMKEAIFARLSETPQLEQAPPRPVDVARDRNRTPDTGRREATERERDGSAPERGGTAPETDELAARRRWYRRPGAIVSAAAAVVLLIAGVAVGVNWPGANGWGAQLELAALSSAPDAQTVTHDVAGSGEVTLIWSPEQERSAVVAEELPDLGEEQTYELWYIDDEGATSAGTFDMRGDEAWRILDGALAPGVAVGITVEPAGGSPQPTTEPIIVIPT
jgi:anti-sigma-K factor RskA